MEAFCLQFIEFCTPLRNITIILIYLFYWTLLHLINGNNNNTKYFRIAFLRSRTNSVPVLSVYLVIHLLLCVQTVLLIITVKKIPINTNISFGRKITGNIETTSSNRRICHVLFRLLRIKRYVRELCFVYYYVHFIGRKI